MVILIRYGEIHLKGLNRPKFESRLMHNIKNALQGQEGLQLKRINGRMLLSGVTEENAQQIALELTHVFGLHSVSIAYEVEKDWQSVCEQALTHLERAKERTGGKSFKVVAKRSDKGYRYDTMQICQELGGYLWEHTQTQVDVHRPDITVYVEIREQAYIYTQIIKGAGGLPVGIGGKAALMISGGIDSPVAGYLTMKRGVSLECVHFFSPPYTGELAKQKVITLCQRLCAFGGGLRLHIVPFTDIQTTLLEKCPEQELTILMRRLMMRITQRIAQENDCKALVTGEAIGQVASQTLDSLHCTDMVTDLPVIRPLICFDKDEIIAVANKIGTFETSTLPYEDCCTVFTPKHPVTAPQPWKMEAAEKHLEMEQMIQTALDNTQTMVIVGEKYGRQAK